MLRSLDNVEMSLLKLTPLLLNVSKHHLRRLQIRNFHPSCSQLCQYKPQADLPVELISIDHDEYGKLMTIYKFPYITHSQLIFNSKFYLALFYFPAWIVEGIAYASGDMSYDTLITFNIVKAVFLAKCLILNKWFTHLVGFIYKTEDDQIVIAYVNFRGRRVDEKFSKDELVLECNKVKALDKLYVNLRCLSTGRTFKLNLKLSIMDEMTMTELFGTLPESAF